MCGLKDPCAIIPQLHTQTDPNGILRFNPARLGAFIVPILAQNGVDNLLSKGDAAWVPPRLF